MSFAIQEGTPSAALGNEGVDDKKTARTGLSKAAFAVLGALNILHAGTHLVQAAAPIWLGYETLMSPEYRALHRAIDDPYIAASMGVLGLYAIGHAVYDHRKERRSNEIIKTQQQTIADLEARLHDSNLYTTVR
jgi:hypothetical protein